VTFQEAFQRVSMAGRELGSGPAVAAERLAADAATEMVKRGVQEHRAKTIALGVAIGLVMAEQPEAMATLDQIEQEWRERHAN
jgi:hypothetical protein